MVGNDCTSKMFGSIMVGNDCTIKMFWRVDYNYYWKLGESWKPKIIEDETKMNFWSMKTIKKIELNENYRNIMWIIL